MYSSSTPFLDTLEHLQAYDVPIATRRGRSIAERRQRLKELIERVEDLIVVEEARVKRMQQQSLGASSLTLQSQTIVEHSLLINRQTVTRMRLSLSCLESAWAI